jgi:hypothetical protein
MPATDYGGTPAGVGPSTSSYEAEGTREHYRDVV